MSDPEEEDGGGDGSQPERKTQTGLDLKTPED
jgi:hypothetical protein